MVKKAISIKLDPAEIEPEISALDNPTEPDNLIIKSFNC